jgi:hypothetical protein
MDVFDILRVYDLLIVLLDKPYRIVSYISITITPYTIIREILRGTLTGVGHDSASFYTTKCLTKLHAMA